MHRSVEAQTGVSQRSRGVWGRKHDLGDDGGGGRSSSRSSSGVGGKRSRRALAGGLGLAAAGAGVREDGVSGEQEDEEVDVVVSEGWMRL